MTILMNTPDPEKGGGVTTYCRVIGPYFACKLAYFTVGSRKSSEGFISSLTRFVSDYVRYFNVIRRKDISLIHLNTSLLHKAVIRDGIFLVIVKLMGKKAVVFFHGWNDKCEKRIRSYFLVPFKLVYSRADAIIVLASEFKKRLIEMGFCGTILTETTAVDDGMFDHASRAVACRRSTDMGNKFNILFLARIERDKGIYEAIDTYHLLKTRHPFITMTVVGDGSELDRVRKYVTAEGLRDIEFTGFCTGMALWESYFKADVYLFPTRHGEGFPISIIEAMAYGLPVLTRPVGGIRDFFEDGTMGFLIESCEAEEWASLLEQLIVNPDMRLAMGEYNNRYAQEHFRPAEIVKRLEGIYQQILRDVSPPNRM